jgi:membrane protein DedA with SNARE-associated domain
MHGLVFHLLDSYGYAVLILLVGLESMGLPLPGETALLAAAAFASQGRLSIAWVAALAAASAIAGDNAGYWIGRKGGDPFLRRYTRKLHIRWSKVERVEKAFCGNAAKTVFLGRFVAFLRTFVGIVAGASGMAWPRFALWNAAGSLLWAALFSALGYFFGSHIAAFEHKFGWISLALGVAILAALFFFGRRWLHRRPRPEPA